MKFCIVAIIFLVAVPIYSLPANPVESAFDTASLNALRTVGHQPNAKFGERIKDWFRRVKNRILGRTEQTTTPPTSSPLDKAQELFMDIKNEDIQYAQRHPEDFDVDVSKIRFDPAMDWGFRLGKWYFIRKSSDSMETNDWNSSKETTYSTWSTIEDKTSISDIWHGSTSTKKFATSSSIENKSPKVTASLDVLTTVSTPKSTSNEVLTTQSSLDVSTTVSTPKSTSNEVSTTESSTTIVTSVETSTKLRDPRENETHKDKEQSAEVLGPSG